MADEKDAPSGIIHTYALANQTDMENEMKQEAMEVTVTAVEKYMDNYENAARMVKEGLDKKFGAPFNVVIGEAYSFNITYQEKSMLLMYTNGNVVALIWRTVTSFG